jgi:hypothetical protein
MARRVFAWLVVVLFLFVGDGALVQSQGGSSPPEAEPRLPPVEEFDFEASQPFGLSAAANEPIDLLVVYTPAARLAVGGWQPMLGLINRSVADTNQSYRNSQIHQRVRLVGVAEMVDYSEGAGGRDFWGRALDGLQKGVGPFSQAHLLREQLGADVLSLFVSDPQPAYCGVAYLMAGHYLGYGFRDWAVSLVDMHEGCTAKWTFAHELGHNFGAHHNPEVCSGDHGAYGYSHGHWVQGRFRTMMSYGEDPRILQWSNPTVSYQGLPTGTPVRDNARSLNQTRGIVVNWRARQVDQEVWVGTQLAPPGQSVLRGSVLVPEALVEVSPDAGVTWLEAATSRSAWFLAWDAPYGADQQEIQIRVNKGASTAFTLVVATVPVEGQVTKVVSSTAGLTETLPLIGATVSGSGLAVGTDGSGEYLLWVVPGPQEISVFGSEIVSPTLTLGYWGRAELTATVGITHSLDFELVGVPIERSFLPLVFR